MFRSEAGGAKEAGEGAWLHPLTKNDNEIAYRNNSHWIVPATLPPVDEKESYRQQQQQQQQQCFITCEETGEFFESQSPNRLLDVAGPSNHVAYFDAASLYPSSGSLPLSISYDYAFLYISLSSTFELERSTNISYLLSVYILFLSLRIYYQFCARLQAHAGAIH